MVREAARGANLRRIMPIGKLVGNALSHKLLQDAVSVTGCLATVEINSPAPNGQSKRGYNRFYHRISATIDGHVDKCHT